MLDSNYLAGCKGKRGYPSRAHARAFLKRSRKLDGFIEDDSGLRKAVYKCRTCSLWHIGNQLFCPACPDCDQKMVPDRESEKGEAFFCLKCRKVFRRTTP
jgi:hypothetical protein